MKVIVIILSFSVTFTPPSQIISFQSSKQYPFVVERGGILKIVTLSVLWQSTNSGDSNIQIYHSGLYQFSINILSMKKNCSQPNLLTNSLSVRRLGAPATPGKKVEGFDRTTNSQIFASKIEKIKKKPKQESLEDQYVTSLQDEIHYLEMELKLLKEKEVAKHSQVDQLETFFGDGIPINENILAIKNGFNNCKNDCERKIVQLETEKRQRSGVIEGLRSRAQRLTAEIIEIQKNHKNFLFSNGNINHAKTKEDTQLKEQIEHEEEILRNLKQDNRKLVQKIGAFQRTKQIEAISILKTQNNKYTKLNKIKEQISNKQKECEALEKKHQDLKKQEEQKTYVIKIEEDNLKLKKKVISMEKELHSFQTKIDEKKMQLEERLKERQKEIKQRMELQDKLTAVKETMDKENCLSMEELERVAKEREISTLQKIVEKNKKLSKYVSYYGELLSKIEDQIQVMGEHKPDLKRQLQAYQADVKGLAKEVERCKKKQQTLGAEIAEGESKIQFMNQILPPAIEKIKKNNDKLKFLHTQRERLYEDIRVREKQLELVEILKGFNLEEIEISNSSNSSIQDRLLDFMRNWESLSRA